MQHVWKASAALTLAGLCCSVWAKTPMTFTDIERMNDSAGLHVSQLSGSEMDSVEGSVAPIVMAAALAGGAIAGGGSYLLNNQNPNVRDFAWHTGMGFTGATLMAIGATMPPVAGAITTIGGALLPLTPPPSMPSKCGAAGIAC